MHLLAHKIKASWRAGQVTLVLFLDIKGTFPNAVPSRLEHNMRRHRVPRKIVTFIHNMLRGRVTALKFNRFTLDTMSIENGIGQGDPLSMVMYQFYNVDMLEIPKADGKSAIAYVDNTIMLATADTFTEVHTKLADMMTREGGVADWSTDHNSLLEHSKLALIDFTHKASHAIRTPLMLLQGEVKPAENTKYLGVIFNQHLDWKAQHVHALGKGTKWAMQIKRLVRPTWGITPKYARKLYSSVAIPRVLYAVDVWSSMARGSTQNWKVNAKVIKQLTTIQRAGALAITRGLHLSPMDALDTSTFLLPMELTIDKWCHRALVCMAMLPAGHLLHKIVVSKNACKAKRHKSPLTHLLARYSYNIKSFKKIPAIVRNPMHKGEPM
jgi:Reverse transcriptase (RNA-dependent DNA polymerase)